MYRRKRGKGFYICLYAALIALAVMTGAACAVLGEQTSPQPMETAPQVSAPPETEAPATEEPAEPPAPPQEQWQRLLVNRWNPLPEEFSVELAKTENGQEVDARILSDLEEMLADANAKGLYPVICSAYRSRETQEGLYANRVQRCLNDGLPQEQADVEASRWVALPGTSEHETGLALDLVSADYPNLDWGQEDTPEQQWLMANSWRYGFILRYPTEKTDITGIYYEPWHYRYVGREMAAEIFSSGLCLEEYLAQLP